MGAQLSKIERAKDGVRDQFMLNQDFETWQRWKACVRPNDCLMPHRPPQGAWPPLSQFPPVPTLTLFLTEC